MAAIATVLDSRVTVLKTLLQNGVKHILKYTFACV